LASLPPVESGKFLENFNIKGSSLLKRVSPLQAFPPINKSSHDYVEKYRVNKKKEEAVEEIFFF
jgi:hypothetical protein